MTARTTGERGQAMPRPTDATRTSDQERASGQRGLPAGIPLRHWRGAKVHAHCPCWSHWGHSPPSWRLAPCPRRTRAAYWLVAVCTAVVLLLTLLAHELAHAVVARVRDAGQADHLVDARWGHPARRSVPGRTSRCVGRARRPRDEPGRGRCQRRPRGVRGYLRSLGNRAHLACLGQRGACSVQHAPGAPLDGGRVLRALMWWRYQDRDRATILAARAGRLLGYFLIASRCVAGTQGSSAVAVGGPVDFSVGAGRMDSAGRALRPFAGRGRTPTMEQDATDPEGSHRRAMGLRTPDTGCARCHLARLERVRLLGRRRRRWTSAVTSVACFSAGWHQ